MIDEHPTIKQYDALADTAKALTNPSRLRLLELLAQRERSVEVLARLAGRAVSTTSANLQVLRRAGLVTTRRQGTTIVYALAGDDVAGLVVALKRIAHRYSPVLHHHASPDTATDTGEPTHETATPYRSGIMLDVRPIEEYAAGHYPGAMSIPLEELPERIAEVPVDRAVTVYCRGEFCTLAREAATLLRGHGLDAVAMDEGVLEWRADPRVVLDVTA